MFAQYFPNFKALIAAGTQIEDAINYGTIKDDDPPRSKKNIGSNSKATEISNIHKNDPYQLIASKYHKSLGLRGNFMSCTCP